MKVKETTEKHVEKASTCILYAWTENLEKAEKETEKQVNTLLKEETTYSDKRRNLQKLLTDTIYSIEEANNALNKTWKEETRNFIEELNKLVALLQYSRTAENAEKERKHAEEQLSYTKTVTGNRYRTETSEENYKRQGLLGSTMRRERAILQETNLEKTYKTETWKQEKLKNTILTFTQEGRMQPNRQAHYDALETMCRTKRRGEQHRRKTGCLLVAVRRNRKTVYDLDAEIHDLKLDLKEQNMFFAVIPENSLGYIQQNRGKTRIEPVNFTVLQTDPELLNLACHIWVKTSELSFTESLKTALKL